MINIKKVLELMGNSRALRNSYQELRKFKGHKVVDIIPYKEDEYHSGFYIKFSNGKFITAINGEDGNNAFKIMDISKFKKSINKTRDYMKKEDEEKQKVE